tara:strand:- start:620 stop:724 length:105 start_codon:yes stop_codon:yes gene_type:complete
MYSEVMRHHSKSLLRRGLCHGEAEKRNITQDYSA